MHRQNRKNYDYWVLVLLFPIVLSIASTAIVVKSGALQSALLSTHSSDYASAKQIQQLIISGKFEGYTEFNDAENKHLLDVQSLIQTFEFILLGIVVAFAGLAWHNRKDFADSAFYGATLSLIFIAIVALFPFEHFFQAFHTILFPQGNYAFPEGSLILQYFPEEYFAANAFWIGTVWATASIITIIASYKIRRSKQTHHSS